MSDTAEVDVAQLVSTTLLVRLLALLAGVVGLVGQPLAIRSLVAITLLGASSIVGMRAGSDNRLPALLTQHPLVVVADEVIVLAVLATVGVESPLVLATCTTAFLVGLLLPLRVRLPALVILVLGYLLVARLTHGRLTMSSFLIVVAMPLIYVMLAILGAAVRTLLATRHEAQLEVDRLKLSAAARIERERLARELHDSVAKTMHGIGLLAAALPTWIERDPHEAKIQATLIADSAETAAAQSRSLLRRLREDQLDRPLSEVVATVSRAWAAQHGVRLDLNLGGVVDVFEQDRYELLAALTEALENVARHSRADSVTVSLHGGGDAVELVVTDNGIGFAPDQMARAMREGHYGLVGLKERLGSVGGSAEVISHPGEGTRVAMSYQLARARA